MTTKKWSRIVLSSTVVLLVLIAAFQIITDPFIHFHKEFSFFQYPLKDERFQNDGLQRHREYNILVTGTSMSQNFNTSKFESLWGRKTIKTCYSGGSFYELSASMQNAINHNPDLEIIICSFDPNGISDSPEAYSYEGIPEYLYDNNPFNDVNYLFNKDAITKGIAVLNYTRSGQMTPSMDLYGRFDNYLPTGFDAVKRSYVRAEKQDLSQPFTEEAKHTIQVNVSQNFVELAERNPQVTFIFYLPPYSYCYWDGLIRTNQLDYATKAIEYASSVLTQADNIELYSFLSWEDVITNLDYYSDTIHYNGVICDRMTESFFEKEFLINSDNAGSYFENLNTFFQGIDYSTLD